MTTNEISQISHKQIKFSLASPFNADSDFHSLNHHFEGHSLDQLLHWSLSTFGDKVAQVTSFGPTGMVILDHLAKLSPGIRVITLDTDFLFAETYQLWEQVQARYPIELDIRRPPLTPETQVQQFGPKLWTKNPDLCCHLRKVIPLRETLSGLNAWITGLRRDQSPSRTNLSLIDWDAKHNLVKINPLATWTRSRIWGYILNHNVPYNPLHDQSYASIGCTHCTRPSIDPADERSGRWHGHLKTECGIHLE